MQMSENIFHKLISNTINENEINTVRFKNLNNNYSKVCLSILLQTFTNHPDANLASQFLNNNKNHSFYKFIMKFKNKNIKDFERLSNKENLWSIFSPTAIAGSSDPKNFKNHILENFLRNDIEINNKITQIIHQVMYWDLPTYQFIILYLLSLLYLIFLWFFFKPDFKK